MILKYSKIEYWDEVEILVSADFQILYKMTPAFLNNSIFEVLELTAKLKTELKLEPILKARVNLI